MGLNVELVGLWTGCESGPGPGPGPTVDTYS